MSGPRPLAAVLLLCLAGGCRSGREADRLLGEWVNGRDRIELLADGGVRFVADGAVLTGRHTWLAPGQVRVELGSVWPSGAPRYWYAMPAGDQLGLCEIRNGRHCMRFARPGRPVTVPPR